MQYSESNPVHAEFHFSALRHGEYVLWAKLWCVVCVGAPSKNCSENYFDIEIRSVEISHARPDNYGVSPTGLSPFAKKLYRTYNKYFYFYFIPM